MRTFRNIGWATALAALLSCARGEPAPPALELSLPQGSGESSLTRTRDGDAVLTWLEPHGGRTHALRVAVRSAGTWSEPRTVVAGDSFFVNWADFPSLIALNDGSWVVHWLARVPGGVYAYHVRFAVSRDQGATWSAPMVAHTDRTTQEHGFVSWAAWDDSTAALVWLDGREMKLKDPASEAEGDMTLRARTVTSAGTLGPEMLLDARTCECCQTALARTATGLVAAYRDRSAEEIRDIHTVRYAGGQWTAPAVVAQDGWHYPGCPVNGPSLAAAGDTVAIAWYTAANDTPRVFTAFSTDGGATWGAPQRVDDGRPQGRVDVELLGDGSALVVWLESGQGQSAVRARRIPRSGNAARSWAVTATSDARSSGFPRLLRVGDEVLFSWTGADGVRVAAGRVE